MMAAEPGPAEKAADAPRVPDEMHDAPEELAAGHPLRDALALCRELLEARYDGAAVRAAETAQRRNRLAFWAAVAGSASVIAAVVELAFAAAGHLPPGAQRPLAALEALAALACFLLLGARAVGARTKAWLADRVRVERCPAAKFRFLLDPALWSRRGHEAQERIDQLRSEAAIVTAAGPEALSEWLAADTIPVVRSIPVGSGIDPHTVHTLMDYYQGRRLDPHLARLAREASAGPRTGAASVTGSLYLASVACVLIEAALRIGGGAGADVHPEATAALVALAAALPFAGAALLAVLRSRAVSDGERAAARHRALGELSERLQKVSGAEAIFRELGFCEDVLESESRDRLRRDLASGWLG